MSGLSPSVPVPVNATVKVMSTRKSKFTVTEATPRKECISNDDPASSKTDALSISFLSKEVQKDQFPSKQIIQKALTGLRPGGVFFVLDYRDQDGKKIALVEKFTQIDVEIDEQVCAFQNKLFLIDDSRDFCSPPSIIAFLGTLQLFTVSQSCFITQVYLLSLIADDKPRMNRAPVKSIAETFGSAYRY